MFDVTVNEQSFSSVAGAKSLSNSLLRSKPYFRTPLGLTLEEAADAGPLPSSAPASGVTKTPAAAIKRTGRPFCPLPGADRLEPAPTRSDPFGPCPTNVIASSPECCPAHAVGGTGVCVPIGGIPCIPRHGNIGRP